MANRKPIVLVSGNPAEIPSGDTLVAGILQAGAGSLAAPSYAFTGATTTGFSSGSVTVESTVFTGIIDSFASSTIGLCIGKTSAGDIGIVPVPKTSGTPPSVTFYSGALNANGTTGSFTFKSPNVGSSFTGSSGGFNLLTGDSYGAGWTSGNYELATGTGLSGANSGQVYIHTGFVAGSALAGNILIVSGCNDDLLSALIQLQCGATGLGLSISDSYVTSEIPAKHSAGVVGVIDASDAAAGIVGEYVEASLVSASATSLTTATAKTVTSISLTAGDWIVDGVIGYKAGVTTNSATLQSGISTTNNAMGALGTFVQDSPMAVLVADQVYALPSQRISISTTTTVYLVAKATFTVSTNSAYGHIKARRVSR